MGHLIINCDLGENEPDSRTEELLRVVTAANIGCGVHAGSPAKTRSTLERAAAYGVRIGAHPGLPSGGGRGNVLPDASRFRTLVGEQLDNFCDWADELGLQPHHVKLHGSLYHAVETNPELADAYLDLLERASRPAVFCRAGGSFAAKAKAAGLNVFREIFADRGYTATGALVPRGQPGALIEDPDSAVARLAQWAVSGEMPTVDGPAIPLEAETVCIHADSSGASAIVAAVSGLF